MIVGGIGFIVVMVLNAFVLDEFDAYGEVPIPGSGQISLPAGEVQISFHTSVTGSPSGSFPVPALKLSIIPPRVRLIQCSPNALVAQRLSTATPT